MPFEDTIVAPATPQGQSAIAMIRVSGPLASSFIQTALAHEKNPPARTSTLGYYKDLQNNTLDQVLFAFFPEESSYTGESLLEICCHGNPLIVQKITEDLIHRGCRLAEPGEFTRTAYLNGKLDLSQAEAVADLIHARSERALAYAQKQLRGALGKKVDGFKEVLLQVLAEVEAYIDFPEEDLPDEQHQGIKSTIKSLQTEFIELINTSHYKPLLQEGIKTVIIGAPNAGKSTLLNTLIGEERALVSETPGTTRDFISEQIRVGEHCLRILDTAGIHEALTDIERRGIEKTFEQIESADFFIVVIDVTEELPQFSQNLMDRLTPKNTIILYNKIDLETEQKRGGGFRNDCPCVKVSLKTQEGFEYFRTVLEKSLNTEVMAGIEDSLVVNARHAGALEKAYEFLKASLENLTKESPLMELVATELHQAIGSIGEIVGEIDNEEMLDKLFNTFCIGK